MSCSQCGVGGVDGICSVCYGNPYHNTDGYYLQMIEDEERAAQELKQHMIDMASEPALGVQCPNCAGVNVFTWNNEYECHDCGYDFSLSELDEYSEDDE